jgi:NitT/TauT family transport system permease protein
VLGFLMGCWSPAEAFLSWPVRILAKLNPIAMLAIFFVLADGEWLFIAMIAFGITPVLTQNIYLAAKDDVPEELIHKAYTLGASTMEVVVSVVGRQVLPRVIESLRLLVGPALVYLIAAEMVVGSVGFGYTVRIQMRLLHMDVVYPYIAILALFGFAIDQGLYLLLRKTCPWYGGRNA